MSPGLASRFMTCETFIFLHMVSSFIRGETYPVNVHCIQIRDWFLLPEESPFQWRTPGDDVVIPPSDFSKSYDIPVEFPCLIKPLFPPPSSLFLAQGKSGSSHHYSQLVGDSSLKGVYQDAVQVNSATCLGKSKG